MATTAESWELLLNAAGDAEDVIDTLALSRFAAGEHPVSRSFSVGHVTRVDDLVPLGSIVRRARWQGNHQILAEGDGWSANLHWYQSGQTFLRVTAVDDEVLTKTIAAIRAAAPPPPTMPEVVSVQFWFHGRNHPEQRTRRLDAPNWDGVARNYPEPTAGALEALTKLDPNTAIGRLVVWHGAPGTGKTTATRVLLRAWQSWCTAMVITDPERLFGDSTYLLKLLLDPGEQTERWRLLVIEDADELLRPDARERSGAVLSRLLNASDGLIGQGLKVLVLLTTNQPRVVIDPAILRPGRCLAEVPFERFDIEGATAWLGGSTRPARPVSLAELYRLRSGQPLDDDIEPPGQYL